MGIPGLSASVISTDFRGVNIITKLIVKFNNDFRIVVCILLSGLLLSVDVVQAKKAYLRIEQSKPSDKNDLTITTVGGLIFDDNKHAHVDLSYLDSELNGRGATLDFGAGFAFDWNVSVFLGVGISFGYNWDDESLIATYYPEAGVVVDISNNFGLTMSIRRIFNLYDQDEDVIMLGIVFR